MAKQLPIMDFYEALARIRREVEPFSVRHVEMSLVDERGGDLNWIEQVTLGPNRKHRFSNLTLGLQNKAGEIRQVYIHSLVEVQFATGEHYRLQLNF